MLPPYSGIFRRTCNVQATAFEEKQADMKNDAQDK